MWLFNYDGETVRLTSALILFVYYYHYYYYKVSTHLYYYGVCVYVFAYICISFAKYVTTLLYV